MTNFPKAPTKCRSKNPSACRYYGAYVKLQEAAEQTQWDEYNKLRKEIEALEASVTSIKDLDKLKPVDGWGFKPVTHATQVRLNPTFTKIIDNILDNGLLKATQISLYKQNLKFTQARHERELFRLSSEIVNNGAPLVTEEEAVDLGKFGTGKVSFDGFVPANSNQAYALNELAYLWVKAKDGYLINGGRRQSPEQKLAQSLFLNLDSVTTGSPAQRIVNIERTNLVYIHGLLANVPDTVFDPNVGIKTSFREYIGSNTPNFRVTNRLMERLLEHYQ